MVDMLAQRIDDSDTGIADAGLGIQYITNRDLKAQRRVPIAPDPCALRLIPLSTGKAGSAPDCTLVLGSFRF